MVYCNFTELQYQFSKTYGDKESDSSHAEFFNLGKNLKIAVHKFGTEIREGNIKTFYHGVGKLLLFDEITSDVTNAVNIYTPLSTTSSFPVAMNFTNKENGMIVYFSGD
eukprot:263311_1